MSMVHRHEVALVAGFLAGVCAGVCVGAATGLAGYGETKGMSTVHARFGSISVTFDELVMENFIVTREATFRAMEQLQEKLTDALTRNEKLAADLEWIKGEKLALEVREQQ
jgi:hypothetical protein